MILSYSILFLFWSDKATATYTLSSVSPRTARNSLSLHGNFGNEVFYFLWNNGPNPFKVLLDNLGVKFQSDYSDDYECIGSWLKDLAGVMLNQVSPGDKLSPELAAMGLEPRVAGTLAQFWAVLKKFPVHPEGHCDRIVRLWRYRFETLSENAKPTTVEVICGDLKLNLKLTQYFALNFGWGGYKFLHSVRTGGKCVELDDPQRQVLLQILTFRANQIPDRNSETGYTTTPFRFHRALGVLTRDMTTLVKADDEVKQEQVKIDETFLGQLDAVMKDFQAKVDTRSLRPGYHKIVSDCLRNFGTTAISQPASGLVSELKQVVDFCGDVLNKYDKICGNEGDPRCSGLVEMTSVPGDIPDKLKRFQALFPNP